MELRISGWDREFEDPVLLPNGKPLKTLCAAAKYIQKLLKTEHDKLHWKTAVRYLIDAAEERSPLLHARSGTLRAMTATPARNTILTGRAHRRRNGDAGDDPSGNHPAGHA